MRFGLTTPVVTLVPRSHAAWEVEAGPEEIRRIAETADRLGYDYLSCSEHVAIPTPVAEVRGGRYYEPAATLGFIAAATRQIRLLTHVIVLPYHHPLAVAKRYGTLDRLSGGRVILGVGVGSLEPEFALLGADFDGRGARYEDALRALRAALGARQPSYQGPHYAFADFIVDPCAVQSHLPIWIGGRSLRSLRRALELADGWDPFGLDRAQLAALLERARDTPAWQQRTAAFDLVLTPDQPLPLDDARDVDAARALVQSYAAIGATALNLRFRHRSLAHYLELLERFAHEVIATR
ncbi:MAG: LLM class F420-dependent oxidoreductase [Candidatus Binatia bacterium]